MEDRALHITEAIATLITEEHVYFDTELEIYRLNVDKTIELLKQRHVYPRTNQIWDTYFISGISDHDSPEPIVCACAIGSVGLSLKDPDINTITSVVATLFKVPYTSGVTNGFDNNPKKANHSIKDRMAAIYNDDTKITLFNAGLDDGQRIRKGVHKTGRFIDQEKTRTNQFFLHRKRKQLRHADGSHVTTWE